MKLGKIKKGPDVQALFYYQLGMKKRNASEVMIK
jgi:hypothetical protein